MRKTVSCLSLATLSALAMPAHALQWSRVGELGLAAARGNTDSDTVNGKLAVKLEHEGWAHAFGGDYLRSRGELDGESALLAQRYELNFSSSYQFSPGLQWEGSVRHEEDRLGLYTRQSVLALNLGWQALTGPDRQLTLSAGPGHRQARLADGQEEEDLVLRSVIDYSQPLADNISLTQQTLLEAGADNVMVQNDLGLSVKLNGHLSFNSGLQLRHNSQRTADAVATDKLLTTSLSFDF
ncbi:MAG: DUF481 domain-containing protein [Xanthomonadales bacterium]|nr:DUF481 domain-containing protein [Xanthomonadales bacterium]